MKLGNLLGDGDSICGVSFFEESAMPNCGNFDPEIFLKCKLEKQLGVGIRHNKNPYDLPDLEFELNGKKIGIEVMQDMKKMGDDNSKRWLEIIDRFGQV